MYTNAVMLIENAERFGLSHCISYEVALVVEQQSYCLLMSSSKTETAVNG